MSSGIATWERDYYIPGGGNPFLYYIVYGDIRTDAPLDCVKYRSLGIPAGVTLQAYEREAHAEVIDRFLTGYVWETFLAENPSFAREISKSPRCLVLRGSVADPDTLDYFRDTIGLMTYLLDSGGIAVYDPFQFKWWAPNEWQDRVFAPGRPQPRSHVVILFSEDETCPGATWFHTRGLRKFGRPEISVRAVGTQFRDPVIDLCERFIELQALGGVIPEGHQIRMKSLPLGGTVHHCGHLDDPDFNNVHVEIRWPDPGLCS